MLAVKVRQAAIIGGARLWVLIQAGAADVQHLGARVVPHLPAGQPHPPAPVIILEIHEHGFVQPTDLFDHLAPDHQACARNPVELLWLRHIPVMQIPFTRVRQGPPHQIPRGRVAAKGIGLGRAVGPDEARARRGGPWVRVHEADHLGQRARAGLRVRVEQHGKAAHRPREALVIGPCEANIFPVLQQLQAGLPCQPARRPIGRGIVHDDDLGRETFGRGGQCGQARA